MVCIVVDSGWAGARADEFSRVRARFESRDQTLRVELLVNASDIPFNFSVTFNIVFNCTQSFGLINYNKYQRTCFGFLSGVAENCKIFFFKVVVIDCEFDSDNSSCNCNCNFHCCY